MEQAMREMSIEDLDLIAQGGMGKIYRINEEQILKVFTILHWKNCKNRKLRRSRCLRRWYRQPFPLKWSG